MIISRNKKKTKKLFSCLLVMVMIFWLPVLAMGDVFDIPDPMRKKPEKKIVVIKQEITTTVKVTPLKLQSTLVGDARKLATINGETFSVGESINGSKIVSITTNEVTLLRHGRMMSLKILEHNAVSRREGGA